MKNSDEHVEIQNNHHEENSSQKHDVNDNIECEKTLVDIAELKNEFVSTNLRNERNSTDFNESGQNLESEFSKESSNVEFNSESSESEFKVKLSDIEKSDNISDNTGKFKNESEDTILNENESIPNFDCITTDASYETTVLNSMETENLMQVSSISFRRPHRLPKLERYRNLEYDQLPGKPINTGVHSSQNIRFHSSPAIGTKKLLGLRKVLSQPLLKYPLPNSTINSESLGTVLCSENCVTSVDTSSNVERMTVNSHESRDYVVNNYESSNIILPGLISSPKFKHENKNRSTSLPLISFSPMKVITRATSTSIKSSQSSQNIFPPINNELKAAIDKKSDPKILSPKKLDSNISESKILNPKPLIPKFLIPEDSDSNPDKKNIPNLNLKPSHSKINKNIKIEKQKKEVYDTLSAEKKLSIKRERITLPSISVKDVKHRSYLLGNLSKKNALLGSTEMQRYLPSRKIRIFIVTWNVNSVLTDESLDNMLLPNELENLPDMYVIGVQEASSQREEWEIRIQETIGPSHVMFHSEVFGTLHLSIFLRRDLIWFCSIPETSSVSTRIGVKFKTKGALAISFAFFGTTFLFITSHFTANENKVQERIMDYKKIVTCLNLPRNMPIKLVQQTTDVTENFDRVFWFGDLNFRINRNRKSVLAAIEEIFQQANPDIDDLLKDDELFKNMQAGNIFTGFREGHISFLPTYKYDVGTQIFDTSIKLRIPSYTDRILYRSKHETSVKCLIYNSAYTFKNSDHKPVYGIFEVSIKPGRDNVPLAAGQFNREIYLTALERRSHQMDLLVKTRTAACSSVCSIM